ncbi:response regulator transcription factor [Actomonas aquatica]|uniref:Response regulator transcription factor n=1 Tax=Actomonas aquatica TaxID=2866162 RepID=A0ABZ1CEJ4_9BACT|nr:response regulator transcription factor [Opitutus sp. WL0086]WRQ89866.1 response regulator transcription factor [Opitutus sp. WL0086]
MSSLLIVDDVPANLSVLIDTASAHGHRVFLAENGERALALAQRVRPEIILLDVCMPGLSGFDVCRQLKQNPELAEIPVIFLTALDDLVDKIEGLEAGAVDYITKPLQPAEVMARVQVHLELRRLRLELAERNAALEAEVARREEAERALRQSLDRAVLVATTEGQILFATQRASRLLKECFAAATDAPDTLPSELHFALQATDDGAPREIPVNGGRLRIRRMAEVGATECVTLLLEEVLTTGPGTLERLGLTPREAEVLYWIAQGKTNPEVAIILANTTGTVKKQVRSILEKLGLETRVAAALRAQEVLNGQTAGE